MKILSIFNMWRKLCIIALCFFSTGTAYGNNMENDGLVIVSGTIWYREQIMLPPKSNVYVFLENTDGRDAKCELIASTSFMPKGAPPWDFILKYDPMKIVEQGRCALRAQIRSNGSLLFASTEKVLAKQNLEKPLTIRLSQIEKGGTDIEKDADTADSDLENTYWKLIEMDCQSFHPAKNQREVHFVLNSKGRQVDGFSGCNRFSGIYDTSDEKLQFDQLISTKMACPDSMEVETRFLKALNQVDAFGINGERLCLYDVKKQPILVFKAVYLK